MNGIRGEVQRWTLGPSSATRSVGDVILKPTLFSGIIMTGSTSRRVLSSTLSIAASWVRREASGGCPPRLLGRGQKGQNRQHLSCSALRSSSGWGHAAHQDTSGQQNFVNLRPCYWPEKPLLFSFPWALFPWVITLMAKAIFAETSLFSAFLHNLT